MSANSLAVYQAELDTHLEQLFLVSTAVTNTISQPQQLALYSAMGAAERIYTTKRIDASLKVQAAYILMNGCRVARDYPVKQERENSPRTQILLQREGKYRVYINRYDERQKAKRARNTVAG